MTQTISPNKLDIFFGVSVQILGIIFLARLTVDTGVRIVYPFIPQLSDGLELTIIGFSWLIFARSMTGLTGPVFGLLADRYSRRKIMAAGLLCQSIAAFGIIFTWQWWAILPMILFGLTPAAFFPASQAYISDKVTYQKRGRAMGVVEFAWAIAGIVSLPIIGWMIDAIGWQSPFLVLAVASLLGAALVWLMLPQVEHRSHLSLSRAEILSVCFQPNVVASIGVATLVFVAVTCFITLWGVWLSADFGLTAAALGLVATGIGLAELGGAGLATLFIDRMGKRRGSQLGLLIAAAGLLLLPLAQGSLIASVSGLILLGVCLEFSIVSLIPLYSEQAPEARATVFAMVAFGIAIGSAVGSPITTMLWEQFGLWAVCMVAAAGLVMAVVLINWFLREDT